MLIDWFTVSAQILNFLILVWLMRRVLYKPIMAAIDARETLVAAELTEAAAKKSAADQAAAEFTRKNHDLEDSRAALLANATDEAKAQSGRLLGEARAAADALQSNKLDALHLEIKDLGQAVGRRAQQAFFTLARRAFMDLANCSLEEQVVAVFCKQMHAMTKEKKDKLAAAILACSEPVLVKSAFALPPKLQNSLEGVINETFGRQIALRFEIEPQLVSGIELTAKGQQIGWSIAEYLTTLERDVAGVSAMAAPSSAPTTAADGVRAPAVVPLLAASR